MKKVYIKAYIKGNLGDDLFVMILCRRYPYIRFTVCGEVEYSRNFSNIPNLDFFITNSFFHKWLIRLVKAPARIINKLVRKKVIHEVGWEDVFSRLCSFNILIAGSCFMEGKDVFLLDADRRNETNYYKTGPIVIGINFGPFINIEYKEFYEKCFKKCKYICFRERFSYELFALDNACYGSDIVFSMDLEHEEIDEGVDACIVISVINLEKEAIYFRGSFALDTPSEMQKKYEKKIVELIEFLLEAGETIAIMGACEYEGDGIVVDRIYKAVGVEYSDKKLKTISYPSSTTPQVLGYFKKAKAVVGSRYHSMILGWLFKKNVYPICYSDKMRHVIEEYSDLTEYTMIYDIDKMDIHKINCLMSEPFGSHINIENIILSSSNHFKYTDMIFIPD